tara:strand:- start:13 stop:162 length:150 start_codon:yes stop_codon:yes gene_type:complete
MHIKIELIIVAQLFIAFLLGAIIGLERNKYTLSNIINHVVVKTNSILKK